MHIFFLGLAPSEKYNASSVHFEHPQVRYNTSKIFARYDTSYNVPRGNDIDFPHCCVPCKYPGYRSHYPKRCLHLPMNECQRKFPQMWHSRRLPFHNKDNCRGHSNRGLYSFRGSVERPNIAKSRLLTTYKV